LRDESERIAIALLFTLWDPSRAGAAASATYVSCLDPVRSWRTFGPNERELLFEDPAYSVILGDAQLSTLRRLFSQLSSIHAWSSTPELLRVTDVIKIGVRPGLTIEDLIVHFVSVQEDLLNIGGRAPMGKLGETFGRRSAFLYAETVD